MNKLSTTSYTLNIDALNSIILDLRTSRDSSSFKLLLIILFNLQKKKKKTQVLYIQRPSSSLFRACVITVIDRSMFFHLISNTFEVGVILWHRWSRSDWLFRDILTDIFIIDFHPRERHFIGAKAKEIIGNSVIRSTYRARWDLNGDASVWR